MQLAHVIPISRGTHTETLSYFTALPLEPGSIVTVPLRNRTVPALVLSLEDITSVKSALKRADFKARKIVSKKARSFLSPAFMKAVARTAEYSAASQGAVLHALLPKELIERANKLESARPLPQSTSSVESERLVFQAEEEDRFTRYRSLIREEFARGQSVFLMVPTIEEGERALARLTRGIEKYTVLLHSAVGKRDAGVRIEQAFKTTHPLLLIGTPPFLAIPRSDLKTLIVEREHASTYRIAGRPHIDLRIFAEYFADEAHLRFILAGLPLRIETTWRYRSGEFDELSPLKLHPRTHATAQIIDMRRTDEKSVERRQQKGAGKFEILSPAVRRVIERAIEKGEKVFLFASRRGLAPITVCSDCGTTVVCNVCNHPVVLHKTNEGNAFICHTCGALRSANETCRICKGWRLEALGIGVERVEDELAVLYPKARVFRLDKDAVNSHKKALTVVEKFTEAKGGILIGTEMALPYLPEALEHGIVVSADSLLSLPEWKISEKIFSLLMKIRECSTVSFLVQTRRPDESLLDYAIRGNVVDFYRSEIVFREELLYPPFYTLIKFSVTGTPARVEREFSKLKERFEAYDMLVYPTGIREGRGHYALHGLVRIKRSKWPDPILLSRIRESPPHINIEIDPENLL